MIEHGDYFVVRAEKGNVYLCGPVGAVALTRTADMNRGFTVLNTAKYTCIPKAAVRRMLMHGHRRGRIRNNKHVHSFNFSQNGTDEMLVIGCQTFHQEAINIMRQWTKVSR